MAYDEAWLRQLVLQDNHLEDIAADSWKQQKTRPPTYMRTWRKLVSISLKNHHCNYYYYCNVEGLFP